MGPHRVGHLPFRGTGRRQDQGPEGPGQAGQGQGEQRRAAAVHAHGGHRLLRQTLDVLPDPHLERVPWIGVAGHRPARRHTGREHRGVLTRAVHVDPVRAAAVAHQLGLARLVQRQRGRALQRVLVEPGPGQDPPDPGHVEALARVAGRGQREQFALEVQPAPHHGRRLQRLVRRAREHRRVHRARPQQREPGGVQRHQDTPVNRLDEARPHHLGQHRAGGWQDRAHQA
jgi:hypothetical protein